MLYLWCHCALQVEPILDVVVDCALHEGMLAAARGFERQPGAAAATAIGSSAISRNVPSQVLRSVASMSFQLPPFFSPLRHAHDAMRLRSKAGPVMRN